MPLPQRHVFSCCSSFNDTTFKQLSFLQSGSEVTKLFMLNLAEHEIFSANEYENANNSWHFHIH